MAHRHPIFRHLEADGRLPVRAQPEDPQALPGRSDASADTAPPVTPTPPPPATGASAEAGNGELDFDTRKMNGVNDDPSGAISPSLHRSGPGGAGVLDGAQVEPPTRDWPGENISQPAHSDRQRNDSSDSSIFDQARTINRPMASEQPRRGLLRAMLNFLGHKSNTATDPGPVVVTAPPRSTENARPSRPLSPKTREKLVKAMQTQLLGRESRGRLVARAGKPTPNKLVDVLIASQGEPKLPDEVFPRLRWGGVFAYIAPNEKSVRNLAEAFDGKRGFAIEQPVTAVHCHAMGLRIPGVTPKGYAFTARRLQLIQPGDTTERFTYSVELTACDRGPDTPDGYVVTKRVPTFENLYWRLRQKFPDVDNEDLKKRARKLVDHVFPTFLTREAAILGILRSNLAPEFRNKVPKPLAIEKDERGFVRTLHMNWMRIGGEPISQLDFARQAAELLVALHEQARIMHLDLRLDNMVITPDGVGFVDFGSACRIGEKIDRSPMLNTLFSEMMRTSQIQRMLGKMIERGHVTNNVISEVHGKVDKTVDSFYLAVQITKPHGNPDLRQLIKFDPESDQAKALSSLTAAVLRPKNPEMAQYKSAQDLLRGIRRIERRVGDQTD